MEANAAGASSRWRVLYEAAVLELDSKKLAALIAEAERAIMDRMEDLKRSGESLESASRMRALDLLHNLRRTELGDEPRT